MTATMMHSFVQIDHRPRADAVAPLHLSAGLPVDLRRFECQSDCGQCCGFKVSLHESDVVRLTVTGHAVEEFTDHQRTAARGHVACMAQSSKGACVLLDNDKRCGVYEHRPLACRTYPFVREAYESVQMDVDLSCPGVGLGAVQGPEVAQGLLHDDDAQANHAALLVAHRRAMAMAKRLAGHRATFEPFAEVVECLDAAAGGGLGAFKAQLARLAAGHGALLPGVTDSDAQPADKQTAAHVLAYLQLWARRQVLWRFTDAAIAVTPTLRSRAQTMSRFLLDLFAVLEHGGFSLDAMRRADRTGRDFCHQFYLEG